MKAEVVTARLRVAGERAEARPPRRVAGLRKPKNPEQTQADILAAAIEEFAGRGIDGARVDAIARRTNTTRAMVYYYFGSKDGLYLAVLGNVYKAIRDRERTLELEHMPPIEAMRRMIEFTFDYYQENPDFVKIVVAENQSGGRYIREVPQLQRLNLSVLGTLADILARGESEGLFRRGIDAVDLHMLIASLGWFQIANRHTFGHIFGRDLALPKEVAKNRALVTETVLRFVLANPADSRSTAAPPALRRRARGA